MGCFSLFPSTSNISQLGACSSCFCVHAMSQQAEPSLQPKDLFHMEYFHCKPQWSIFPRPLLCTEMPQADFPPVAALLLPHLVQAMSLLQRGSNPRQELLLATVQAVVETTASLCF